MRRRFHRLCGVLSNLSTSDVPLPMKSTPSSTHTRTRIRTHTHVNTHMHTHMHTHTHIHTCTYTYTRTYTQTHVYTHTHTRADFLCHCYGLLILGGGVSEFGECVCAWLANVQAREREIKSLCLCSCRCLACSLVNALYCPKNKYIFPVVEFVPSEVPKTFRSNW